MLVALALLVGVGWFGVRAAMRGEPEALTLEERYRLDDRIRPIDYECHYGKPFDAPTVDMLSVLVSKLNQGQRDVLKQAKRELAEAGAAAVPYLRTLFDDASQSKWRAGVVSNVLDVCALMEEPAGIEMIRLAVNHPQSTVRLASLRGLKQHGDQSDYDSLVGWLSTAETGEVMASFGGCMQTLDPERFYADFVTWLEQGAYSAMWPFMISSICAAREADTVRRLLAVAELRDVPMTPFLIAPAARDGDTDAMARLHAMLEDEDHAGQRQLAVQALSAVGLVRDIYHLLSDPHAGVRKLVAAKLIDEEPTPEIDGWLARGLDDPESDVRELCLVALVERGDERAIHQALELLDGHLGERDLGISALRAGWERNPESRGLALERLLRISRSQGSAPGQIATLQTISLIPLRAAAEYLLNFGQRAEGRIKGLTAYRWCVGQIFNTGPVGRQLLREQLESETDPFRRLSLIEYIWQDRSQEARECLMGVLRDDTANPWERLYAGDRLTVIGPAGWVAPVLKRVYLSITHLHVRPALQCMLWTWYGQHYE